MFANLSNTETTLDYFSFGSNGFSITLTNTNSNTLNDEYLFLAFAETNLDATKSWTDYDYATNADTISIRNNSLVSLANGFNASGQVDTQYEFTGGVTRSYGTGHENKHYHLYTNKLGVLGETEYRPLEGWNTRDEADKWGVQSPLDASLRTTARHFDYESETGVALASGEDSAYPSWEAFDKSPNVSTADMWRVASTTTSWLQYKKTEPRILKSWRILSSSIAARDPKRFTIEGSNDGLNWTAIDSTYTASDYSGNGALLWGGIQSTAANTTAYLYHRINITLNNGDATYTAISQMEFNTILPANYYLAEEGKMYDASGAPIERTYLGEFKTDADGDIIISTIKNYGTAKQRLGEVEVHKDLTVHGEIQNRGVATAWVTFDGVQNPPLIDDSFGVADIIDVGTGRYALVLEEDFVGVYVTFVSTIGEALSQRESGGYPPNNIAIRIDDDAGTPLNRSLVSVIFFGGKEIK